MIFPLTRWPALMLGAALTLSACAGQSGATMPNASGIGGSAILGAPNGDRPGLSSTGARPNASCPTRFVACGTVSKTKGADFLWCYGPSTDPCSKSDAGKVKWSGVVCLAKGKTCKKPIKQLTAKWSGPFKCKSSDKCSGTYELDAIKPGTGLKETTKYIYKQDIHTCKGGSCGDEYIGLDVGP